MGSWRLQILLLSMHLLAGCRRSETESQRLSRLSTEASIAIPAHSRIVEFDEPDRLIDPVWAAKVALPRDSYPAFRAILEAKPSSNNKDSSTLWSDVAWWRPHDPLLTKDLWYTERETSVLVVLTKENNQFYAYIAYSVY